MNIDEIWSEVKKWDKEEQFILLQRLLLLIKKPEATQNTSLRMLSGLGREIWKDTDIDNYIDEERQWR